MRRLGGPSGERLASVSHHASAVRALRSLWTEMRALTMVFVSGLVVATMSAQAAPLARGLSGNVIYLVSQEWAPLPNEPASRASADTALPIELVSEGCGPGWHRHQWLDRWGHWHWGHCVPNWR
jgi:hypothetical protein